MNITKQHKRLFFVLNLLFLATSLLAQDEIEKLPVFPLKSITNYCQGDTSLVVSRENIIYDSENYPLESSIVNQQNIIIIKKFNLNDKKKISDITYYQIDGKERKEIRTLVYKYSPDGKLIYYGINKKSDTIKSIHFLYNSQNQLINKLVTGKDWSVKYTFDYDPEGHLLHQLRDGKPFLDYSYDQNGKVLKVTQKKHEGSLDTIYHYNDSGFLLTKELTGKTLEKNVYRNNRIIEQWFSDLGPDPCIEQPCCMKTFLRFEYY